MNKQYILTQASEDSNHLTISTRSSLGVLTPAIYVSLPNLPTDTGTQSIAVAILTSGNDNVPDDVKNWSRNFEKRMTIKNNKQVY